MPPDRTDTDRSRFPVLSINTANHHWDAASMTFTSSGCSNGGFTTTR
jgi:hypothetical protein